MKVWYENIKFFVIIKQGGDIMVIILGSENPSKKRTLEMALIELEIIDYDIICVKTNSGVPSRPIGFEIIRGADNRNQEAKRYASSMNIDYDYICGIEGGFSLDENGIPFVVTYVITEDFSGKKSTGKSLGVRLRKDMFDYIKSGGSLNQLIEEITGNHSNKQNDGIIGYLTNGLYQRDIVDKEAVMASFIPFIFKDKRDILSDKIHNIKSQEN